jgi:hypothetical protein
MEAPNDDIQLPFIDFIVNSGFIQFVNNTTRGNNLLDLVSCNDPHLIFDCSIAAPLSSKCDHSIVKFGLFTPAVCNPATVVHIFPDLESPQYMFTDFKQANYVAINSFLSAIDWQSALSNGQDVQENGTFSMSISRWQYNCMFLAV